MSMRIRLRHAAGPALILAAALLAPTRPAAAQMPVTRETAIVLGAADVMRELTEIPGKDIPLGILEESEGIAIFPDMIKAGFVVGGRHGNGVVMMRRPDGTWSSPIFLMLSGGSVGWQIGAQATDVVLLFRSRKSVEDLLVQRKITLGVDAAIAAGPLGRQAEASTDLKFKAEILSYSRSRGLFAGAAIQGAGIRPNDGMNLRYYGGPRFTLREILDGFTRDGAMIEPPPSSARLQSVVADLTGAPARQTPPVVGDGNEAPGEGERRASYEAPAPSSPPPPAPPSDDPGPALELVPPKVIHSTPTGGQRLRNP